MNKTAGMYKGRKINAPDEKISRPTLSKVRMGVFNALYSILGNFDGKSFLDLFGGSGVMGLEALSRGFSSVKVCEKNPQAAAVIRQNYANLGVKPDLYTGDSIKFIQNVNEIFDVIYIDPPYYEGIYEKILPHISGKITVVEHPEKINLSGYNIFKQKKYGDKIISFLSK